ncbi:hypothetical protein KX729_28445 [Rhizobium sp. XQZ8]|uniref:hypothetical protein n=1 Tax=Rhizobium populisoli TaxID=2859785 RepID=UPI001CA4C45A|nr:hypothetical protein [Rhizobium populisoli]MBW6425364.1 hypothetical protein [Rhizobium populisoli]
MTAPVSQPQITGAKEVVSVVDFAVRYGLCTEEKNRLVKLFGHFARKHELLMNARRETRVR